MYENIAVRKPAAAIHRFSSSSSPVYVSVFGWDVNSNIR